MGVARLFINWLGCKSRHEVHNSISSLFLLCVYHPHTMIHVCIQVSTHHIISHQMLTDFHNQLVELSYYICLTHIKRMWSLVMFTVTSLVMCQTPLMCLCVL